MTEVEREQLALTALLLDQGRFAHALAVALTALAAALALAGRGSPWGFAVIGVGLLELYLAARVGLDAALLRRLATEPRSAAHFDPAMRALDLLPESKTGRPWAVRCRGAKRLLVAQGLAVTAQCALAAGSAIL